MVDFEIIHQKIVFEEPWAKLVVDTLLHRGKTRPYYYLISPTESVAVVGITSKQEVILTYQYRHPVRRYIFDLPAGGLLPGETPLTGARREFEEETGFYPNSLNKLGYFNQFPGSMKAGTHLFFAKNLIPTQQNLDPNEELTIVFKTANEILDLIKRGQLIDGSLQLGILLALQLGKIPSPSTE
jgi:ADP-ribose pyrophosphatase